MQNYFFDPGYYFNGGDRAAPSMTQENKLKQVTAMVLLLDLT